MCPQDWAQITLLFGQKFYQICLKRSHEVDCLMEEFQDLVILAAGWRLISEIKYDSTVTPIFVLVTFQSY